MGNDTGCNRCATAYGTLSGSLTLPAVLHGSRHFSIHVPVHAGGVFCAKHISLSQGFRQVSAATSINSETLDE